jgi:hypothetical protein
MDLGIPAKSSSPEAATSSPKAPVTDAKVNEARQKIDTDCKAKPAAAAYIVALRTARSM